MRSLGAQLGRDPRPSLFELRLAERRLSASAARLDARLPASLGLSAVEGV